MTDQPTALLSGVTGQCGSFLAELLLSKGYVVHGIIRRASTFNTSRIEHLLRPTQDTESRFHLHYGDLTDSSGIRAILEKVRPTEIFHMGAQSHVRVSFDQPEYTAEVNAVGTLKFLEATRDYQKRTGREVRFYNAGSSEMFGASPPPQNEQTPFRPCSPYGVSKIFAHYAVVNYRESYGMFAVNGILFNSESARRGETFVTRKITRAATRIAVGLQQHLFLGNLDAKRDWGYAPEYMEAVWLMLQQPAPDDFVIATGEIHTVQEFLEAAFSEVGLDWRAYVKIDPRYFRPAEVDALCGDSSKARAVLGWEPKTTFPELVKLMVAHDMKLAMGERLLKDSEYAP